MINIKRELTIFSILFVVTSLGFHFSEWLSMPVEHFSALLSHPMPYHPFLYVFLIYIVIAIVRAVIALLKKLFIRK